MSEQGNQGPSQGCWTCKLRRKKCDKLQLPCGNCRALDISCYFGPRPSWMDGGKSQEAKGQAMKNEIKRNATLRRDRASASKVIVSDFGLQHEPVDVAMSNAPTTESQPSYAQPALHTYDKAHVFSYPALQGCCPEHSERPPAIETDFIMKYLDFVFPALFPYYRPTMFDTGRSWLLALFSRSKVAYHAAASLSSYFFTMALTDASEQKSDPLEHALCKAYRWDEIEDQTRRCFENIRIELSTVDLSSPGSQIDIPGWMRTMQSVIQLLVFEVALGKAAPWRSHLPPTMALFEQIMESSHSSQADQNQSRFASVLMNLGQPMWAKPGPGSYICSTIWNPEQAGFRFNAGLLVYYDIMASFVRQESPRLSKYYDDILAQDNGSSTMSDTEIQLSSIIGCRNWVMKLIAEISTLHAPTHPHKLDSVQVSVRRLEIRRQLTDGILALGQELDATKSLSSSNTQISGSASALPSIIWAHAALLYLAAARDCSVVEKDLQEHVMSIMELFRTTSIPRQRAIAWPICVAGCLVPPTEESAFKALFISGDRFHTTAALDDVLQILEQTWTLRRSTNSMSCALANYFNIEGSPIMIA